jgi:hypothetical protein
MGSSRAGAGRARGGGPEPYSLAAMQDMVEWRTRFRPCRGRPDRVHLLLEVSAEGSCARGSGALREPGARDRGAGIHSLGAEQQYEIAFTRGVDHGVHGVVQTG